MEFHLKISEFKCCWSTSGLPNANRPERHADPQEGLLKWVTIAG